MIALCCQVFYKEGPASKIIYINTPEYPFKSPEKCLTSSNPTTDLPWMKIEKSLLVQLLNKATTLIWGSEGRIFICLKYF